MSQSQINLRVDDTLREQAERIFDALGCSFSSAFTIFLRAVVRQRGLSFLPLDLSLEETVGHAGGEVTASSAIASWEYDDFVAELERRVAALPADDSVEISVHTIFDQSDELKEIGRQRIGGNLGKHLFNNKERFGLRHIPESANPAKYHKVEATVTE